MVHYDHWNIRPIPLGALHCVFLVKTIREVHLPRPPDQGAGAAIIFASPGWYAAICGPGLTGLRVRLWVRRPITVPQPRFAHGFASSLFWVRPRANFGHVAVPSYQAI